MYAESTQHNIPMMYPIICTHLRLQSCIGNKYMKQPTEDGTSTSDTKPRKIETTTVMIDAADQNGTE